MNEKHRLAEDWEEELRRHRLTEGEQRLASCWRAGSLKRAVHQPALERVQHLAREELQYLAREKLHQLARGKLH